MSGDETRKASPSVMLVCDYSLEEVGGAQVAFVRQARALVAQGWTVVVVAPGAEEVLASERTDRLIAVSPAARFTLPRLGLPILRHREQLQGQLLGLVARFEVSGIVMHSEFALAAAALRVGAARRIPVLHTVHTFFWSAPTLYAPLAPLVRALHTRVTGLRDDLRYSGSTAINNALRSMTLRVAARADIVLSPSVHQTEALRGAGVSSTRTLSNVSGLAPAVSEPPPGREPLTLVWAARFASEKRLHIGLEAVRLARARLGPGRVHLHVAGGDHSPQDDVTFHGRVSTERVSELIEAADAVLITSLGFDNQPMVALEAFSRRRPTLVTDPVLHREFGRASLLSSTPDAGGLADLIVRVAGERSLLPEAGSYAAAYAEAHRPAQHAAALRAFLLDAAAKSPPPTR